MRKSLISLLLCTLLFSSCNYQIIDLKYGFSNAYVKIGEEWHDLEIASWKDYEGEQLQLTLKDGTVIVVSSMNCILYDGRLPGR